MVRDWEPGRQLLVRAFVLSGHSGLLVGLLSLSPGNEKKTKDTEEQRTSAKITRLTNKKLTQKKDGQLKDHDTKERSRNVRTTSVDTREGQHLGPQLEY
ncbi:hypothetical protein ElyMa_002806100 [Elysia marginata]|uniref:Uncharacterized protein n=1 Tax=Elysia marginata TaxID=1093978 RepID=A0AAV4HR38_9GAST|nr:hypothetical protein ElyMa_002806100 [Elysia marginata]